MQSAPGVGPTDERVGPVSPDLLPAPGADTPSAVAMLEGIEATDARSRWLAFEVLEDAWAMLMNAHQP